MLSSSNLSTAFCGELNGANAASISFLQEATGGLARLKKDLAAVCKLGDVRAITPKILAEASKSEGGVKGLK